MQLEAELDKPAQSRRCDVALGPASPRAFAMLDLIQEPEQPRIVALS